MAKAIAKPPRLSTSHPKFHDRKHAPELDILPMLLAAAGGSPGQIMGKNCTLPAFYCWRLWLMVWRQRMAKKVTSNRIAT